MLSLNAADPRWSAGAWLPGADQLSCINYSTCVPHRAMSTYLWAQVRQRPNLCRPTPGGVCASCEIPNGTLYSVVRFPEIASPFRRGMEHEH